MTARPEQSGYRNVGNRHPIGNRLTRPVTAVTAVTAPGGADTMTTSRPELATLLAQLARALTETPTTPTVPEPRPMPERVLFTVEEAAERLGIGRSLAFRLIRDREIESVQIGRLRRVPVSALAEYAARLVARQSTTDAA